MYTVQQLLSEIFRLEGLVRFSHDVLHETDLVRLQQYSKIALFFYPEEWQPDLRHQLSQMGMGIEITGVSHDDNVLN